MISFKNWREMIHGGLSVKRRGNGSYSISQHSQTTISGALPARRCCALPLQGSVVSPSEKGDEGAIPRFS